MTTLQKLTKAEDMVTKLATALSAESERLTVALDALHKLLALKPEYDNPSQFYFTVRDIAREGVVGKR
jgi:hypothetical protein